ncbi:hypothetical protein AJGP001_10975 [Planococcus faecalis]|uniref:Uncharacterized protein n=1 Tax=Planococcus faecalis TaxID=1598147 RepID=A0ABN4XJ61_9BACL|nr:hypothetical protein [Planococcus faecalis]AQU79756.1 hypothetical protein AJGP001_10975 [Planococcus faecalis]
MSELSMQFNEQNQGGVLAQATASREMEEVKGAIFLAKQFPRNVYQAEQRILDSCKRPALAAVAMYQYPRGGTKVTGPSIRLAEVLAQNWGNLSFGVKELEQRNGESIALAYAWDLETNTRQEKVFTVKHSIKTKTGMKVLDDPRDIYELVANNGSRRVRACILGIIPGDIVEKAVEECGKTLAGNNKGPLKDRIAKALNAFKEQHRVTQEMIEDKFGYNADSFTEHDFVELINIFNSIKDGLSKSDDWFDKNAGKDKKSGLAASFEKEEKTTKKPSIKDLDKEEVKSDGDKPNVSTDKR